MNTQDFKERGQDLVRETENYVRGNPLPTILGALAVGFVIGVAIRAIEKEREPEPLRDALNEIRGLLKPIGKKTRDAYAHSSDAVLSAVEQAVEKARDIHVDEYVDPVAKWWKKMWA